MTIWDFIRESQDRLSKASLHFSNAEEHARQIVLRALNLNPTQLFFKKNEKLSDSELQKLVGVLERRLKGEPLQYILGFEYFYDSRFEVGPGCLIPRKETEQLVDEVLAFRPGKPIKVAELGAGSGNIGISVTLKRPDVEWHAFEINPDSVVYLKKNIKNLLSRDSSYVLHEKDFFSGCGAYAPYDVLLSNPPYISSKEFKELPQEVLHEPEMALRAGEDGLEIIKKLIRLSTDLVKPGGLFLCEIAASQGDLLQSELCQNGMPGEVLNDLAGLPRILKLCLRTSH